MTKIKYFILSLLLVLTFSFSVSASEGTGTITVNNAENATLHYMQIIKESSSSSSGYETVNVTILNYLKEYLETDTEEETIWSLLYYADNTIAVPADVYVTEITGSDLMQALYAIANYFTLSEMDNPQEVSSSGLYLIIAQEEGYTYSPMTAFVGYDENEHLENVSIDAKKTTTSLTKTNNDEDSAVAVGDTVTYTITAYIPYIDPNIEDTDKTFIITDINPKAKKPTVKITVDGEEIDVDSVMSTLGGAASTGSIISGSSTDYYNFSSYIDNENSNAGKEIVITYTMTLWNTADLVYTNSVYATISGEKQTTVTSTVYTGRITLTSYEDDGVTPLADTTFNLYDSEGNLVTFLYDEGSEYYIYNPSGTITDLTSDSNGKIVLNGLNSDGYYFVETSTPSGYMTYGFYISASLDYDGEVATEGFETSVSITNSKSAELPVTGGNGITVTVTFAVLAIFTGIEMNMKARKMKMNE